jgi:hypothetical protein
MGIAVTSRKIKDHLTTAEISWQPSTLIWYFFSQRFLFEKVETFSISIVMGRRGFIRTLAERACFDWGTVKSWRQFRKRKVHKLLFLLSFALFCGAMVAVNFELITGIVLWIVWVVVFAACVALLCSRGYHASRYSSLHTPIYRDELTTVRWMIRKGELMHPLNDNVSLNHPIKSLEMVRLLIDSGVSLNKRGFSSYTPLYNAVRWNDLPTARLLVERGVDVNYEVHPYQGQGAPIFVVSSVQMAKLLVEAGADLTRTRLGLSILDVAAAQQDVAVVHYLIQAAKDKGTPFTYAFLHVASPACARILIAHAELDTDVDAVFPNGPTALCTASLDGECDKMRFLMACGATVDGLSPVRRKSDRRIVRRSAIDVCCMNEMAALLLAAGAHKGRCQFDPSAEEIADARRRIARDRVDLIRARAFEVCVALEALELPALLMCEILEFACAPFASCVPFHHKWNIVIAVKHREPLAQWSSARSRSSSTSTSSDEWIVDVVGESSVKLRQ